MKKIRVLIVDDSRMERDILSALLSEHDDIEVVGAAADAFEARNLMDQLDPDVVTLDVEMPKMNGLEFLDKIMRFKPKPVIMISAATQTGSDVTFRALELGAVDFMPKPKTGTTGGVEDYSTVLGEKIRSASRARLFRHIRPTGEENRPIPTKRPVPQDVATSKQVIAVGASTGGTEAIREFLYQMPEDCPAIVIVQHMPEHFTKAFADRLNSLCVIHVSEASHNMPLLPGHAYVAPGGKHLWVKRENGLAMTKISNEQPMNLHRPSVDFLFLSVAKYFGLDSVGVLMTGMGKDGAQGLLKIREAGGWTIAQDEATSVIYGMPREAVEIGAARDVAPLPRLRELALTRARQLGVAA